MTVKIIQGMAFVGDKYLICIGTEEEVVKATCEQLSKMVIEAVATAKFNGIGSSQGRTVQ